VPRVAEVVTFPERPAAGFLRESPRDVKETGVSERAGQRASGCAKPPIAAGLAASALGGFQRASRGLPEGFQLVAPIFVRARETSDEEAR
jgi:hypothetical protein